MLVTQITQLQAELAIVDAQIVSVKAVGCVVPSSEVVIGD
jgi:phospholipid N-methyltransferase